MTTTTRAAAWLAAGALSLSLVACGSEEPEVTEPGGTTADAASTAGDDAGATQPSGATPPPGADVAEGEQVPIEDLVARLRSPGEERLQTMELSMVMGMDGDEVTLEGLADFRDGSDMDLVMTMPDVGEIRMLMVDGTTYMQVPGDSDDVQYIEMSPADLGLDESDLTSTLDMTDQWSAWEEGSQEATFLGREDVDGEEMDRFRVEVDAEAMTEAAGETAAPEMPETVVYDVWVDDADLMRRFSFDAEGVTMDVRLDGWGEDLGIEAPDPSQVVTMGTGG